VRRPFEVRLGTAGDLHVILDLIEEAASWLRTRDTDQWARPWPTEEARNDRVLDGLRAKKTWIAWDGEIPVATITTDPKVNPEVWAGQPEQREPVVYVHRLVVSRNYAHRDIGAGLLDWAGEWAVRTFGARWIRIDVWTKNVDLHSYYEQQGFRFVGYCADPDYPSGSLFERAITTPEGSITQRQEVAPSL